MSSIAFHLCTVPDVEAGRQLYGFRGLDDGDVIKAMEHIGRQARDGDGQPASAQPGPALQKVIAASVVLSNSDGFELHTLGAVDGDEKTLLEGLFSLIGSDTDALVSWNGSETILPLLNVRALGHGIVAPDYWKNCADGGGHVDLSSSLLGPDSSRTDMSEIASLLGLPHGESLDAEQIQDAWFANDLAAVQNWCDQQALNTLLMFMRYQLVQGVLPEEEYRERMALFRDELQRWDDELLNHYAEALNG